MGFESQSLYEAPNTSSPRRMSQLKILRQLVEYQLTHSAQVREVLDRAWGVKAMSHKKKDQVEAAPPPPEDPFSQTSLLQQPIGQDTSRKRYWVLDSEHLLLYIRASIKQCL